MWPEMKHTHTICSCARDLVNSLVNSFFILMLETLSKAASLIQFISITDGHVVF